MTEAHIEIREYPIKLGQFLKLAEIVQDGLEAKFMILEGEIRVNGEIETRRGRKLVKNDCVEAGGNSYICS